MNTMKIIIFHRLFELEGILQVCKLLSCPYFLLMLNL